VKRKKADLVIKKLLEDIVAFTLPGTARAGG